MHVNTRTHSNKTSLLSRVAYLHYGNVTGVCECVCVGACQLAGDIIKVINSRGSIKARLEGLTFGRNATQDRTRL